MRLGVSKALRFVLIFASIAIGPIALRAASLDPGTLDSWQSYLCGVKRQMEQRLRRDKTFLWVVADPIRLARVRKGEIVVSPTPNAKNPQHVTSGLIHDWIGAVFIPGATLKQVFRITRDYANYKVIYRPSVIDSKVVTSSDSEDRFSLLLQNKSFFHKTALETEYEYHYVQLTAGQAYGISQTTRVQQINGYGAPGQHILPQDEGDGFIWRLCSIMRFLERDGGVYLELRAVALSRDIPFSLCWLVEPVVRRVARDSIVTCLLQTRKAVLSRMESTKQMANHHARINARILRAKPEDLAQTVLCK